MDSFWAPYLWSKVLLLTILENQFKKKLEKAHVFVINT